MARRQVGPEEAENLGHIIDMQLAGNEGMTRRGDDGEERRDRQRRGRKAFRQNPLQEGRSPLHEVGNHGDAASWRAMFKDDKLVSPDGRKVRRSKVLDKLAKTLADEQAKTAAGTDGSMDAQGQKAFARGGGGNWLGARHARGGCRGGHSRKSVVGD